MNKITSFFVFVAIVNNQESIMMAPDIHGNMVPLAYTSKKGIEEANTRKYIENIVKEHKIYFELREYRYIETLEVFEPMASMLTM